MSDLDDYAMFVAILDSGSISAAARRRHQSVQSASRALARLEQEVGTQLVRRTTRTLMPTPAGIAFLDRIRGPVIELELARAQARDEGTNVTGQIRVGAPIYFGSTCLAPAIAGFAQRWPELRAELVLTDSYANLLDERLDMTIRIGTLPDSGLRGRRLASLRRVFFAAPSCLERNGYPSHPQDLERLPCVVRTFGPERDRWPAIINGKLHKIPVKGVFLANDAAACNEVIASGSGIGIAPYWQVRPLLESGRVELLLTAYEPPRLPVQVLWNGSAKLPTRSRMLIEFLSTHFREADL